MALFWHELKRGKIMLAAFTGAIAFMLGICVIIYPEMAGEMAEMSNMFADMGAFSEAFGMDQLNFGEFMGYFGIECGNTLGLGGALFAALLGIGALAKEEKDKTAEFLLSHPISRTRIVSEKLLAVILQLLMMNLGIVAVTLLSTLPVEIEFEIGTMLLLFFANFLLQVQIAAITFGISAFLSGNGLGIGLGIAFGLYFLQILANLIKQTEFLKFITPFAYTDGSHIVNEAAIEVKYLVSGLVLALLGIAAAYWQYNKKDIA